jgi:hypothetical protein
MDAKKKAAVEINDRKEELRNILSESPLYLDLSLRERENFVRYLASIVLHEKPWEDAVRYMVRERRRV